jgi:hypothetical protein
VCRGHSGLQKGMCRTVVLSWELCPPRAEGKLWRHSGWYNWEEGGAIGIWWADLNAAAECPPVPRTVQIASTQNSIQP